MKRKENNNKQTQGAGVHSGADNMASLQPRRGRGWRRKKKERLGKAGRCLAGKGRSKRKCRNEGRGGKGGRKGLKEKPESAR